MTPRFHLAAEEELAAAMNAGEARGAGLGLELLCEVQRVTELLCKFPDIGEKLDAHRHRFPLTRFPFGVIFRVEGDTLTRSEFSRSHTVDSAPDIGMRVSESILSRQAR